MFEKVAPFHKRSAIKQKHKHHHHHNYHTSENVFNKKLPPGLFYVQYQNMASGPSEASTLFGTLPDTVGRLTPCTPATCSSYRIETDMDESRCTSECTRSYAEEEHRWSCGRMCEYIFMLLFTIIFIATSFSLLVYWLCKYRDGVIIEVSKDSDPIQSFEGNEKYINLHAILMTTGLITCGGFAMMFYRLFSCCPRLLTKILHFIILSFSGALSGYGLKVAYEYHVEHKPEAIPHLRSLHSWIGIVCVALFALQYLIGFVSFVLLAWVRSCDKIRETIGTIHAALGCIILALAVCATCTALQRFSEDEKTSPLNTKALLLNVIVISFVGVLIVVVYSVRRPRTQYEAKIFVTERL